MRAPKGFTLLEVVLAVGLLAVVLLAFTGLQVTAIRALGDGRDRQEAAKLAENFIEDLRRDPAKVPVACTDSLSLGRYGGACAYVPCALAPDGSLACGAGISSPSAYRVEVVARKGDKELARVEGVVGR